MNNKGIPPPGSGPPQRMQPPVAIVQAPVLGPDTTPMTCPYCQANISTRVKQSPSTKTHLLALLLCLVGGCLCVPCLYCSDCCLAKKHYCPACNAFLGEYQN